MQKQLTVVEVMRAGCSAMQLAALDQFLSGIEANVTTLALAMKAVQEANRDEELKPLYKAVMESAGHVLGKIHADRAALSEGLLIEAPTARH